MTVNSTCSKRVDSMFPKNMPMSNLNDQEVERSILKIKQRIRSTDVHGLPFKILTKQLVIEVLKHSVTWLNQLPADDGVSGAITLTATGNAQDLFFMSMITGRCISRHQWTKVPMASGAIDRVDHMDAL
jgi:hypothetical protein